MSGGRSPEERERARLERERRRAGGPPQPPAEQPAPQPPAEQPAPHTPAEQPAPPAPEPQQPPPAREQAPPQQPRSIDRPPAAPAMPPSWDGLEERLAAAPPPPPQKVSHAQIARNAAIGVATLVVLVGLWFVVSVFQPFAGDGKGEGKVPLAIPAGADVSTIGQLLAEHDVVASARKFGWRANWSGKSQDFKAGRFEFAKGMSYAAAIELLAAGPNAGTTSVVIPEGRSRWETATQTRDLGLQGDYMSATKSSPLINLRRYGAPAGTDSLEGFLFPATYELPSGSAVVKLVPQQVEAFKQNIVGVDMSHARKKNLTVFDVVTIASLIDREVSVASERKLVAAVIYNRLKAGIPLGIDATSRFETRNWTEPLTNAVLQKDTPYNTRINKGLPPGPIGSPGLAAIKAAASPARSAYLYYVANPCKPGSHTFTKTYEEFQAAADRYNRAREQSGNSQPSGC